jgi:hypothetical protein
MGMSQALTKKCINFFLCRYNNFYKKFGAVTVVLVKIRVSLDAISCIMSVLIVAPS